MFWRADFQYVGRWALETNSDLFEDVHAGPSGFRDLGDARVDTAAAGLATGAQLSVLGMKMEVIIASRRIRRFYDEERWDYHLQMVTVGSRT